MDPQLFNYLEAILITTQDNTHNKSLEILDNGIVQMNILGLWGNHGLIQNYNTQEELLQQYDHKQLMMASHIVGHSLLLNLLQWISSYNPLYYYPYKKYFNNYCYYQYQWPIGPQLNSGNWRKNYHACGLKVGQKIHQGPIGNIFFQYAYDKKKPLKTMDQYKIL